MFRISFFYFLATLAYLIFIKYFRSKNPKANNEIIFNDKNSEVIKYIFVKEMIKRLELLEKMGYNEWINYNQKNNRIKIGDYYYYFNIWEKNQVSGGNLTFINKVSQDPSFQNLSFNDILRITTNNFVILENRIDPNLIKNMYGSKNDINEISYFWFNTLKKQIEQRNAVTMRFDKNNINGIIELSYVSKDVNAEEYYNFVSIMSNQFLIFLILFVFTFTGILFIIFDWYKDSLLMPLLIFIVINTYIISTFNKNNSKENYTVLNEKFTNLNSSTLSLAFLISVNIYVINALKKTKKSTYYGILVLFISSLFFLLGALYRNSDYKNTEDIRQSYVQKELIYNMVILMNIITILTMFVVTITGFL